MSVTKELPERRVAKDWRVYFEEGSGEPVPKAQLLSHPLCERCDADGRRSIRITTREDGFILHVYQTQQNRHTFEDLCRIADHWINAWKSHFDVQELTEMILSYTNVINSEFTPDLVKQTGGGVEIIDVSSILNYFSRIPGAHHTVLQPFFSEINIGIDDEDSKLFTFLTATLPRVGHEHALDSGKAGFQVVLSAKTMKPSSDWQLDLHWGHNLLIEQFEAFFSQEAKQAFSPLEHE